jgi:hypothetical protein
MKMFALIDKHGLWAEVGTPRPELVPCYAICDTDRRDERSGTSLCPIKISRCITYHWNYQLFWFTWGHRQVLKSQVVEGSESWHTVAPRFECGLSRAAHGWQSWSLVVMSIDAKPTRVRLCCCAKRAEDADKAQWNGTSRLIVQPPSKPRC